ncbi:MAG: 2-C-methyl-D-erythritol 4-phosphate cytidylyltransferase [Fuerstiella sp.]|nr:2-C-methyl-D-erythritol 4-phosphate cytidylyltransferase [Fuerstiella sp.]
MADFAVILPAAGSSSRFRGFDQKKTFIDLRGVPVWKRTVQAFAERQDVKQILLILQDSDTTAFNRQFGDDLRGVELITGGASRSESVRNGLLSVKNTCEFVAVHDVARPLIRPEVIDEVFSATVKTGAAIPGVSITSTVKRINEARCIESTVDRSDLVLAQTPQGFSRRLLLDVYTQVRGQLQEFTDEAAMVESVGHSVTVTDGAWDNIKITTAADFQLAQMILAGRVSSSRD